MGEKKINIESLVDTKILSEILGVSEEWVKEAKRNKALPYYKVGRLVKFRVSEIEKWLKERHES